MTKELFINTSSEPIPSLRTPAQLIAELRGSISMGLLRKQLLHRKANGMAAAGAVINVSKRKLLIDISNYVSWLRTHSAKQEGV